MDCSRVQKKVEQPIREEGLVEIFEAAGFALRQPGCSACLAMNDDKIPAGKIFSFNLNRTLRRSPGALVPARCLQSPLMAAAAAITGVVFRSERFWIKLFITFFKKLKMSIEKFQKLVSTVVPLPIENVDTDRSSCAIPQSCGTKGVWG